MPAFVDKEPRAVQLPTEIISTTPKIGDMFRISMDQLNPLKIEFFNFEGVVDPYLYGCFLRFLA